MAIDRVGLIKSIERAKQTTDNQFHDIICDRCRSIRNARNTFPELHRTIVIRASQLTNIASRIVSVSHSPRNAIRPTARLNVIITHFYLPITTAFINHEFVLLSVLLATVVFLTHNINERQRQRNCNDSCMFFNVS